MASKIGRPKQFDKLRHISFFIEQTSFDTIKKISEKKGVKLSTIFRKAIDAYLDNGISVEVEIDPDNLAEGVF